MTHGTSAHGGSLSRDWADAGQDHSERDWRIDWQRAARQSGEVQMRALSAVAGLAVGLVLTAAWQAELGARLAALLATGAAAAFVALRPRDRAAPAPQEHERPHEEESNLLAQMHHELRTPLNAVIGFSEVMLHELHGPLGNARYQEYAAHISESGGRLLKASEDALAVAATMSALLAERHAPLRKQLCAAQLVLEAWAALGAPDRGTRLRVEGCAGLEIECDGQATRQALQHLLAEAADRTAPSGTVVVGGSTEGSAHSLEIAAERFAPPQDRRLRAPHRSRPGDGLRLILARSLLKTQGAAFSLSCEPQSERWSARIAFPTAAAQPAFRRRRGTTAAAARQRAAPARRGDFAAAPASAARASVQSLAAPPA